MASKPGAEGDTETHTDRGPGRIFSETHQFSDVWSSKYEAAVDFEIGEELRGGERGKKSMKLRSEKRGQGGFIIERNLWVELGRRQALTNKSPSISSEIISHPSNHSISRDCTGLHPSITQYSHQRRWTPGLFL